MRNESNGKVAVITGSTNGIGAAIARSLSRAGYSLVLTLRRAKSSTPSPLSSKARVSPWRATCGWSRPPKRCCRPRSTILAAAMSASTMAVCLKPEPSKRWISNASATWCG